VIPVTAALTWRALRSAFRRPQFLAPLVIFPSLMLAVNTGGLHRSTDLPGFPHVPSFLSFQLAAAITQSLMLNGVQAGIAMALEIEGGFFDRLVASPIPRVSIVLGRVGAAAGIAVLQVAYFLVVGLIFGSPIKGGVAGVAVVLGIAIVAAMGFGALGVLIALRARSASVVQGIFPIVFVILFLSSAFFPRALLSSPADAVARFNPLSYIADGMRNPIITSIASKPVLDGLLAAAGLAIVATLLSVQALRGRLREA
jgi:ABC-2 type transport system permease protein